YPVTPDAALFFAYGHFSQFPALGEIFGNSDYRVLNDLAAGGIDYGVLGNPDIKPEITVQYQFGYRQAFADWLGMDLTTFYKDIRDLLGVEFISTYNGAEYARLTNVDFGNVLGITLALDHQELGPVSVALDYTWQRAQGNASDPRETATRASAGEDPRPRVIPLSWDQRHTVNLTVTMDRPAYTTSAILRVVSGQPYTPILEAGFGQDLGTNAGRRPSAFLLDLRAGRSLGNVLGADASMFLRAFNVFDTRYFNGFVFESTGSPYYSRFPEADRVALGNPTRFQPPRRIEVGITLGSGGS
ncbi:MAG TPA: TonB-dependent receptor, partial [bacterium]|nr:TonB-dependent receptor [bacterium]